MQQFLHLEKAVNLAGQSHHPASLAVQLLTQAAVNLAVQSHHPAAAAFLAAADAAILANQLNVITVRMVFHPAFFYQILRRAKHSQRPEVARNEVNYNFSQGKWK